VADKSTAVALKSREVAWGPQHTRKQHHRHKALKPASYNANVSMVMSTWALSAGIVRVIVESLPYKVAQCKQGRAAAWHARSPSSKNISLVLHHTSADNVTLSNTAGRGCGDGAGGCLAVKVLGRRVHSAYLLAAAVVVCHSAPLKLPPRLSCRMDGKSSVNLYSIEPC
jgi:hypothetical protein